MQNQIQNAEKAWRNSKNKSLLETHIQQLSSYATNIVLVFHAHFCFCIYLRKKLHFHLPERVPVCPIGNAIHKVVHLPPDAPGKQCQVSGVSNKCPHLPVVGVLPADVRVVVAVGAGQQPEHLVILRVGGVKPGGLVPGITHHLKTRIILLCS